MDRNGYHRTVMENTTSYTVIARSLFGRMGGAEGNTTDNHGGGSQQTLRTAAHSLI
jgi:hypothetical protein